MLQISKTWLLSPSLKFYRKICWSFSRSHIWRFLKTFVFFGVSFFHLVAHPFAALLLTAIVAKTYRSAFPTLGTSKSSPGLSFGPAPFNLNNINIWELLWNMTPLAVPCPRISRNMQIFGKVALTPPRSLESAGYITLLQGFAKQWHCTFIQASFFRLRHGAHVLNKSQRFSTKRYLNS